MSQNSRSADFFFFGFQGNRKLKPELAENSISFVRAMRALFQRVGLQKLIKACSKSFIYKMGRPIFVRAGGPIKKLTKILLCLTEPPKSSDRISVQARQAQTSNRLVSLLMQFWKCFFNCIKIFETVETSFQNIKDANIKMIMLLYCNNNCNNRSLKNVKSMVLKIVIKMAFVI